MASLFVDNVEYRLLFGSDVMNDGTFLELQDPRLSGHQAILVAWRSDASGKIVITALREQLPLAVITRFLEAVRAEWPAA